MKMFITADWKKQKTKNKKQTHYSKWELKKKSPALSPSGGSKHLLKPVYTIYTLNHSSLSQQNDSFFDTGKEKNSH